MTEGGDADPIEETPGMRAAALMNFTVVWCPQTDV